MHRIYRPRYHTAIMGVTAAWMPHTVPARIRWPLHSAHCADCSDVGFTYVAPVNGCYKVLNRKLQWSIAGLECRSLHKDAHLLVINTEQEQLAVAGFVASTRGQCQCCWARKSLIYVNNIICFCAYLFHSLGESNRWYCHLSVSKIVIKSL